jgi:hypothetical protein
MKDGCPHPSPPPNNFLGSVIEMMIWHRRLSLVVLGLMLFLQTTVQAADWFRMVSFGTQVVWVDTASYRELKPGVRQCRLKMDDPAFRKKKAALRVVEFTSTVRCHHGKPEAFLHSHYSFKGDSGQTIEMSPFEQRLLFPYKDHWTPNQSGVMLAPVCGFQPKKGHTFADYLADLLR